MKEEITRAAEEAAEKVTKDPLSKFFINTFVFSYIIAFILSQIITFIKTKLLETKEIINMGGVDFNEPTLLGKAYYYVFGFDLYRGPILQLILLAVFAYLVIRTVYILSTAKKEKEETLILSHAEYSFQRIIQEFGVILKWFKLIFTWRGIAITLLVLSVLESLYLFPETALKINPFAYISGPFAFILAIWLVVLLAPTIFKNLQQPLLVILGVLLLANALFPGLVNLEGVLTGTGGKIFSSVQGGIMSILNFLFGLDDLNNTILSFEKSEALFLYTFNFEALGVIVKLVLGTMLLILNKPLTALTSSIGRLFVKAYNPVAKFTGLPKIEKPETAEDIILKYDKETNYSNDIQTLVTLIKKDKENRTANILRLAANINAHNDVLAQAKLLEKLQRRYMNATNLEDSIVGLIQEMLEEEEKNKKKK